MINDIKKIFKMAKYIPGIKSQVILMGVMFLIGTMYEFLGHNTFVLSGMYMLLPCSTLFHTAYTGNASSMVQTSSIKKFSQTIFPYIFAIPYALIIFSVVVLHRLYIVKKAVATGTVSTVIGPQANDILTLGIILFTTLIYMSLCYKVFVGGLVAFFTIALLIVLGGTNNTTLLYNTIAGGSLNTAIALGYCIVIIGCVSSVVSSFLLYKKDISKLAIKSVLRVAAK